MSNLFKKGFASLALASAMASGVFAGNAVNVDFKKGYQLEIPLHVIGSDNENAVAFKMNIKNSKIIATFDKSAGQTDSKIINLFLSKKVAGERIKGANILFKELKASGKNLMPNIVDEKIGKLTFAINQTDRANVLIISAASKKDWIAAMPIKVALSRIDKKIRLAVTRDRIGFKDKNTIHLFANNINLDQWNEEKEKIVLGDSNFKKLKAMTPNLNLLSDTSEGTTDKNITNANLLIKSNGQAGEAVKSLASSVIHAKPSAVATTTDGKVINQNTLTATNILDANKYGKALASSVIYAKDSVVATTTVGTAANNTYIINANSDLDVNSSGEVLSFSVLDTKPSVVTAANNNINSTSSNVNTGNNISFVKSFENTFMIENNTENEVIYNLASANNVTNLKNNTAITAANTAATMNNTEKTKTKKATTSANSLFNSDTIGSFAAIASDNGELKKTIHYNYAG